MEVEIANGATVAQVCKKIGVAEQTHYRWRAEYGGMRVDQARSTRRRGLVVADGERRLRAGSVERDELLVEGILDTLREAQVRAGRWRKLGKEKPSASLG